MAVIFAAVGGGVVIGALAHEDYSDHYDHTESYSDAAERRRRRIEAAKQETESAARDLSSFKRSTVNPQLTESGLRQASAMTVSESAMDADARRTIDGKVKAETDTAVRADEQTLAEIDLLLARIQEIEEEENGYEA